MIFRFDDNGMKEANAEKGGNTNEESFEIHESYTYYWDRRTKVYKFTETGTDVLLSVGAIY